VNIPPVTPDDVADLWRQLFELDEGGGSSNDWAQAVDDWFTAHGYPTILYGGV
jgi:hypothetical protein